MKPNPIKNLFSSRKFWLLILDTILVLATFFVGRYLSPDDALPYLTVIGALQPVFVFVINGITREDVSKTDSYEWARSLAKDMVTDAELDSHPDTAAWIEGNKSVHAPDDVEGKG